MIRQAIYRAVVRQFDASTGIVSCIIPQLYGYTPVSVGPLVARQTDIASIVAVSSGDTVYVFASGGDDEELTWIPVLLNLALLDGRYVNVNGDTMTGQLTVGTATGDGEIILSPATNSPSDRASLFIDDWNIGQDLSANGTKDLYFYQRSASLNRLYIPSTGYGILVPTNIDGGWRFGRDTGFSQSYNAIATVGMTSTEYIILSDGTDTYISSGASSVTNIRGPANDSTHQLAISGSGATLSGQLIIVGGILYPQTGGVEGIRLRSAGDFISWYSGATRLGYVQMNGGSTGGYINAEVGPLQLLAQSGFYVITNQPVQGGGNTTGGATGGLGFVGRTDSGGNTWHFNWSGSTFDMYVDAVKVKTFVIPHPSHEDKLLVHAVSEGPTSDVVYRDTDQLHLEHGRYRATVVLPDYFESLTEFEGRTVQLTLAYSPDMDAATHPRGWDAVPLTPWLAADEITGGCFYVYGNGPWKFHWEVKAVRKNTAFEVEPDVEGAQINGVGPYTWLSPN